MKQSASTLGASEAKTLIDKLIDRLWEEDRIQVETNERAWKRYLKELKQDASVMSDVLKAPKEKPE